jgi:ABC-2 type transport system ATP-binding protein
VASGTPAALKAEVGRPHLDLVLADGSDVALAREVVRRFGVQRPPSEGCNLSIGLQRGAPDIAPILRALDDAGFGVAELELKQPTLDDVFLEKTGEHLEGAEEPEPEPV